MAVWFVTGTANSNFTSPCRTQARANLELRDVILIFLVIVALSALGVNYCSTDLVATRESFRRSSQNFSPAGVTSPFVARAMPTDCVSVVPVSGQ
jgi:hypothetical protein